VETDEMRSELNGVCTMMMRKENGKLKLDAMLMNKRGRERKFQVSK
jgi:hypothetical protein